MFLCLRFQQMPQWQTFFFTCMNRIITERREGEIKENKISRNKNINNLLFADDKVILAASEDKLQISVRKLETVTSKHRLIILKITCSNKIIFPKNYRYYHLPKRWPFLLNHSVSYEAFTVIVPAPSGAETSETSILTSDLSRGPKYVCFILQIGQSKAHSSTCLYKHWRKVKIQFQPTRNLSARRWGVVKAYRQF
jgi:hypothetical protein